MMIDQTRLRGGILLEDTLGDVVKDRASGVDRKWYNDVNETDLSAAEKEIKHILENPEEEFDAGKIESTLDQVLKANKRVIRTGGDNFVNVLFIGPAGTGKTARIKAWARKNNINLVHKLASTMDDTDLGGAIAPDKEGQYVQRLASTELDELANVQDSVLFLDEYNRAYNSVRGTLLTLIQEHTIPDPRVRGGKRFLPNFLFTIAAINPEGEYNVNELDKAEKTRFMKVMVPHEKMNTLSYLKREIARMYDSNMDDPNVDQEEKAEFATELLGKFEIAKTVLSHPDFDFIETDDVDEPGVTSARTFTNLVMFCDGTKKNFIDNWNSFCDPSQKTTIERILREFKDVQNKANSIFTKNKEIKKDELGDEDFLNLI